MIHTAEIIARFNGKYEMNLSTILHLIRVNLFKYCFYRISQSAIVLCALALV